MTARSTGRTFTSGTTRSSAYGMAPMAHDGIARRGRLRAVLTGEHPVMRHDAQAGCGTSRARRAASCAAAPFGGPGGAVLRHFGFGRFPGNPAICDYCITQFREQGVTGAEIPVTLLFADIRGSTGDRRAAVAGRLPRLPRPLLPHRLDAVLDHDGLRRQVRRRRGHRPVLRRGHRAGTMPRRGSPPAELLIERCARADATPMGPIPVGAAVHTGDAYVGTSGPTGGPSTTSRRSATSVNTTARLASSAAAGELLVSVDAAEAAGRDAMARSVGARHPRPAGADRRHRAPAPGAPSTGPSQAPTVRASPPLQQDDVPPAAGRVLAQPLLDADPAEPDPLVQGEARRVVGHDAGQQRPDAGRLAGRDERRRAAPDRRPDRGPPPPRRRSPRPPRL